MGWRLGVSGRTKIAYVADDTNDSQTTLSQMARAAQAGKGVLRHPFLVVCLLLLVAGCSEDPHRAPVEVSPEDTPTSEARPLRERPAGPARDTTTTSGVMEGAVYGYTYGLASGNRVVRGEGRLPRERTCQGGVGRRLRDLSTVVV